MRENWLKAYDRKDIFWKLLHILESEFHLNTSCIYPQILLNPPDDCSTVYRVLHAQSVL